jgi:hypothetical protein
MARQSTTPSSIEDEFSKLDFRSGELFTTHKNSPLSNSNKNGTTTTTTTTTTPTLLYSPLNFSDDANNSLINTIREEYQVRTIGTHNIARLSILPIYPPFCLSPTPNTVTTTSSRTPNLLMANVPSNIFNK